MSIHQYIIFSTTLRNWDISLPQLLILATINIISTCLITLFKKTGRYKIGLWECNQKDTANKTWAEFKSHFRTAHQELKDFSDKTVVDSGFQSAHIVSQVVEGLANLLNPTEDDTENTSFQMANATSQYTQILPQLVQKMQQNQTLMDQMQTQLNNNNLNGGTDNSMGGASTLVAGMGGGNKLPFWRQLY